MPSSLWDLKKKLKLTNPDEHIVLPEVISKEPLGPMVRQGDDQWFKIARWTLIALINEPGREVVDGHYRLSEEQAKAILDLRLQRLTALGRDEIKAELDKRLRDIDPTCGVDFETVIDYPGLDTPAAHELVTLVKRLAGRIEQPEVVEIGPQPAGVLRALRRDQHAGPALGKCCRHPVGRPSRQHHALRVADHPPAAGARLADEFRTIRQRDRRHRLPGQQGVAVPRDH